MNRRLFIIIGAQRSGKSFFSNELIKKYLAAGNSSIIYNLGRPTDFEAAREIFLMSEKQHIKIIGKDWRNEPEFLFYEDEGQIKDFRNFCKDNTKKAVKAARLDLSQERLFFESFYYYVSNCLLILDDARAIFRNGVKAEFLNIFSRLNHTGRNNPVKNFRAAGSDVIVIFHSLDHVNKELFDYATHLINFKYAMKPDFDRVENQQIRSELKKSFEALEKAPKYSYTITDIQNLKTKLFIKKQI
jgi:hypothetical protein